MRLPQELNRCVVYLYKDAADAERGSNIGGTGFWASPQTSQGRWAALVTNRHVVEDGFSIVRWVGSDGKSVIFETDERDWAHHESADVAIALKFDMADFGSSLLIPTSGFISSDDIGLLDMRLGDDVCMMGRHLNYDGGVTNTPTARFGHLVQFPNEPILDERGRSQQAFLVQIPSLPGFSGSPVFLIQDETEKDKERGQVVVGGSPRIVRLLGINCGHIPAYSPTYVASTNERNQHLTAEINSGISIVAPAWTIAQLISSKLPKVTDLTGNKSPYRFGLSSQ